MHHPIDSNAAFYHMYQVFVLPYWRNRLLTTILFRVLVCAFVFGYCTLPPGVQVTSTRCWNLGDVDGALRAAFLEIDANMRRDKVTLKLTSNSNSVPSIPELHPAKYLVCVTLHGGTWCVLRVHIVEAIAASSQWTPTRLFCDHRACISLGGRIGAGTGGAGCRRVESTA